MDRTSIVESHYRSRRPLAAERGPVEGWSPWSDISQARRAEATMVETV